MTGRDGDYVQQWGVEGSDVLVAGRLKKINRQPRPVFGDRP